MNALDLLANLACIYLAVRLFEAVRTPGSLIGEFFADLAASRAPAPAVAADQNAWAQTHADWLASLKRPAKTVSPKRVASNARTVRVLGNDAELAADAIIELADVGLRGIHSECDDVECDDLVLEIDDVRIGKDMISAPVVYLGEGRSTDDRITIGDLLEACEVLRELARQHSVNA